ncbi:MmcQ/YjbR family DNA-binding protein [Mucilaginibacter sp. AW1-3]
MKTVRQIAFAFGNVEEVDHFHLRALKANKKIFATLWQAEQRLMVKLSPTDQSVFHSFDPTIFFPVPNKWGLQGCTFIDLAKVREDMLQDALFLAYERAFAKKAK